jgi:hypothetical protein
MAFRIHGKFPRHVLLFFSLFDVDPLKFLFLEVFGHGFVGEVLGYPDSVWSIFAL